MEVFVICYQKTKLGPQYIYYPGLNKLFTLYYLYHVAFQVFFLHALSLIFTEIMCMRYTFKLDFVIPVD